MRKSVRAGQNFACMVYWIPGERRIGKTVNVLAIACRLYQCYGCQTMWLRNKKVELEDDGFVNTFLNSAKNYSHCPDEWITKKDGVWASSEKDAEQIIMFQSISTFSNRRGAETPKCILMVFDEFMPEDRKYPKSCAKGLMSLTKTVLAGKENSRCICMSNIISAGNPYFVKFGIYPDPKRSITTFKDKGMLIECCQGYRKAIEQSNPWNAVYMAGKYQDYASAEEDSLTQLVVDKWPKGGNGFDYVLLNEGIHYRGYLKNNLVYWEQYNGSVKDLKVFAVNLQEVGERIYLIPDFIKQDIKTMVGANCVRFKTPNVMFGVLSCIFEEV